MSILNSLFNLFAGNSGDSDDSDETVVLLDKVHENVSHPNHAVTVRARDYDPKSDEDNMTRQDWLDSQR